MSDEALDRWIEQGWRDLGFYYELDDATKAWRLVGSRRGLLRFRDALRAYAANPSNAPNSEHEHYGPYLYLELMTWHEAGFDGHPIRGPLADLLRLADMIETKLELAVPGSSIVIREDFAIGSPYSLILDLRDDEFDPANADDQLRTE